MEKKNRRYLSSDGCSAKWVKRGGGKLKDDSRYNPVLCSAGGKTPILIVGLDMMAHVVSFLPPDFVLEFLTMPLCKDWKQTYSCQEELWRILCASEPFKAKLKSHHDSDCSSNSSIGSYSVRFGEERLRYTSYVRCVRYLDRIKEAAVHKRPLSAGDVDVSHRAPHRGFVASIGSISSGWNIISQDDYSDTSDGEEEEPDDGIPKGSLSSHNQRRKRRKANEQDKKKTGKPNEQEQKKPAFAQSMITQRLLGPPASGKASSVNLQLPWSCAIYSIVNWMVSYADVEGIQMMCLRVLPFLLEDEQQRSVAREAGLTDIVIRGMTLFPNSAELHTISFHAIVLLARPLGGKEGMLMRGSLDAGSEIFSGRRPARAKSNKSPGSGKECGIPVMLDSMRRFSDNHFLQTTGCWSLVNVALAPAQKELLVKLGAIDVLANTMKQHPHNGDVQIKALMALVNLVSPCGAARRGIAGAEGGQGETSEEAILPEMIGTLVRLVVAAMKTFMCNELVLSRACLVLRNISLTESYHTTMLWTPDCYSILNWCVDNYRHKPMLQQSALKTIHRLQATMSNDDNLRRSFEGFSRAQLRRSLEKVYREALHFQELTRRKQQHHHQQQR